MSTIDYANDVAVIGMSGAFPGARTVDELWKSLCEGREMIRFREKTQDSGDKAKVAADGWFVPAVAAMDGIDLFDASFFAMTHAESELTDPQHRVLLEHCWCALEHAGYNPRGHEGVIGVYAGATINTYLMENLIPNRALLKSVDPMQVNIGNGVDFLTTRISYKMNLTGPSHTVQSACSTSLVAVHCACRSLLDLECDMALAGAVSINMNFLQGYQYQDGGILSPDGRCRVFDAEARGTVFGSGVGVVVLKRLEDALADGDHIHAVIKGSAVNNDGLTKAGFTAPSVDGQASVIAEALGSAGVDADTISYIECHGTGTLLGDPVEIRALTKAFQATTQRRGFCAVGSVKSNLGHLDAAAGVTGLIKVVLSLEHGLLPPSLHYKESNPEIDFVNSPFYVNTRLAEWRASREGVPRRAGVSAFGVGGTNAHVVLEEAPKREKSEKGQAWQLLPVSARSGSALKDAVAKLAEYLRSAEEVELADVSYTLQVGRQAFGHRWAVTGRSRQEVLAKLEAGTGEQQEWEQAEEESRKIAFLFPGQGAQSAEMGKELYRSEKIFRRVLEQCGEILRPQLGVDLCAELYAKGDAEIDQTWLAQPALFAVEYGLAQQWMGYGVRPKGMLGHSLGEYTAACIAGVWTLEEALRVVAVRGKLMQQLARGAMLAVALEERELEGWLVGGAGIAAINGPGLCTASGTEDEISEMEERLRSRAVHCQRLRTSHAYHGRLVEPMMEEFRHELEKIKLKEPQIPFISNVSGSWITAKAAQDPGYWVRHLRQPVQFERGIKELRGDGEWLLLEVGPGQTLRRLAQRQATGSKVVASLAGGSTGSEMENFLRAVGKLWKAGVEVDWKGLHAGERRHRLPLPTYPFERKRYWIDPPGDFSSREEHSGPASPMKTLSEPAVRQYSSRPALRNAYVPPRSEAENTITSILENALGIRPIGATDKYGELGGDSLTAIRIIGQLNSIFGCNLQAIDLYEGLEIREIVSLIESEQNSTPTEVLEREKTDRRRMYQTSRRSLHQAEPARNPT